MTASLFLALWLLAASLAAFLLMGLDKRKARAHAWRIPEKVLLLPTLLGGAPGAFVGMHLFRHKTRHWYFRFGIPVLLALQILLAAFLAYVSDYYRADAAALAALEDTPAVRVTREGTCWRFDGPGEDAALVFYPGGKVEPAAYAPLLSRLAGEGLDCFLVRMPFNLAVFGRDRAGRVMAEYAYDRWYLSGHSLGGVMAASYAAKHPDAVDGLVLLASYPSAPLTDAPFPVLSAYGTCDGVVNMEKLRASLAALPAGSTELPIDGGNHAQFGSYGPQSGDGAAAISAEAQWALTAQAVTAMALTP